MIGMYSKTQYDRAADICTGRLAVPTVYDRELEYAIASEWRARHEEPLRSVTGAVAFAAQKFRRTVLLSSRLKRFPSIIDKLKRERMRLTSMQDIAGCRAVVARPDDVYRFAGLVRQSLSNHYRRCAKEVVDDYIERPRASGYRGFHLVAKWQALNAPHDDFRVEIQIRSEMQHAWAMAVEAASLATGQPLKAGGGDEHWQRFFVLLGDIFAELEQPPLFVNEALLKRSREEARHLARQLDIIKVLETVRRACVELELGGNIGDKYLLQLNMTSPPRIHVRSFSRDENKEAIASLERAERHDRVRQYLNVVLVSAANVRDLRDAYPSYFLKSRKFRDILRRIEAAIQDPS